MESKVIHKILTGGQTGVDQGATDAAIAAGYEVGGWVPLGGWAEDFEEKGSLLERHDCFVETGSPNVEESTRFNIRDSLVTLVIAPNGVLDKGTQYTIDHAFQLGRVIIMVSGDEDRDIFNALRSLSLLGSELTVNIAGPRESSKPGSYELAHSVVSQLLDPKDFRSGQLGLLKEEGRQLRPAS